MAAIRALLGSSATYLPNPNHRLSPRIHRFCNLPLNSAAPQIVETQPKLPITNVIDILRERGLVHFITSDKLRSVCCNPDIIPLKVYCGFDPTAESLHLGNLLGLIVLLWFRRCGHNIVALIGGCTGQFGDPSGTSVQRPELSVETIEKNSAEIEALVYKILRRACVEIDLKKGCIKGETLNSESKESCNCFTVLNNIDWWKELTIFDFFRDIGKYARIKDPRLPENNTTFNDLFYPVLQGYDYWYMFKNIGVNVQIGGRDQSRNITFGTKLVRKAFKVKGAYGLTFPLLLKSDGSKYGKSEYGSIWLSPSMLSPYKFYQYLLSVPDVDVVRFLKILTFLNLEEIQELEEAMKKSGYVPNSAQKKLAEEVTRFVHGEEGLAEAMKAT